MDLKPSHFCDYPWSSILQKSEAETIACNIMKIRRRLGDKWELTWEEYQTERKKDGHYSELEESYFNEIMPLIPDAIGAISFSGSWAAAARAASKSSPVTPAK